MKKYTELVKEDIQNINEHDGILIIVDVQKAFDKYTPDGLEEKISEYCKKFNKVYQIWDANKAEVQSYNFPNQVDVIRKNYGTKFSDKLVKITNKLTKENPNIKEGDKFKFGKGYIVRINNNHKWFYVNSKLLNLYNELKGKKVILIGGANFECLTDIFISLESFGVNPIYDYKYIYDASMKEK